jgi:hypothetical protein
MQAWTLTMQAWTLTMQAWTLTMQAWTLTMHLFGGFWSTTWKTRQKNTPIDWEVGEGGRYALGLAWLIFTTAMVF